MFFKQIMAAFLVRTEPDSSMVNPAHIHMTNAPHTMKEKVLNTKAVSPSTPAAWAIPGWTRKKTTNPIPAAAMMAAGRW